MYLSTTQPKRSITKNEFANYALDYYRKKYYMLSVLNLYRKKAMGGNIDQVLAEMKKSTKQQYLDRNGVKCLYCKSKNIKGGVITTDEDFIYQKVNCLACGKIWLDVYTLTDVLSEN